MPPIMPDELKVYVVGKKMKEQVTSKALIEQAKQCMITIKKNKADKTEQFTKATYSLVKYHCLLTEYKEEEQNIEKEITKISVQNQTIEFFCELCVEILESGERYKYPGIDQKYVGLLIRMLLYLVNTSDNNCELSGIIARKTGFLTTVIKKLQEWKGYCFGCEKKMTIENGRDILGLLCNVMHNISVFEDYVPNVRDVNCIEAMKPYLDSKDERVRLLCLGTLADLVNESECDILKSNDEVIKLLLSTLSDALVSKKDGWSIKELVRIVQHVARNDSNKRIITKHGAVPILVKIMCLENIEDQREGVCAIWELAFDNDIRLQMTKTAEWKVKETLQKLTKSNDEEVQNNSTNALLTIDQTHCLNSGRLKEGKVAISGIGHTMISYNWGNQSMAKQIRDSLNHSYIKTWFDENEMHKTTSSIFEAMAEGVEKADLVLVCYSAKYKNSRNCRAEAEYAFALGKRIIPLKMEKNYVPDGWLGLIVRSKLYYDFSGEYAVAEKVNELIMAIQYDLQNNRRAGVYEHNLLSHTKDMAMHGVSMTTSKDHHINRITITRHWTCTDVQKWLKDTEILKESTPETTKKSLEALDGKNVVFLKILYLECPKTFYKTIADKLGIDEIPSQTDFRLALEDINVDLQKLLKK